MPRPRKYQPSWIDDEGFKPAAYKFLRELVVVYQTKEELVGYLKKWSWKSSPHVLHKRKIISDIEEWLLKQSVEERRYDHRLTNCKDGHIELIQQIYRDMNARAVRDSIAPTVYDEHRFNLFIKDIRRLLIEHRLSIESDSEGNIIVSGVGEGIYSANCVDDWFNEIVKR